MNTYIRTVYKAMTAALMLPAAMLFSSCDEEYLTFDAGNPGIYFTKDTLNYSFGVTPTEIKRYTYKVPVRIMAPVLKEARPIGYEVNPEYTNAEEGKHFEFGEAVILPDSINGYIPVTFHRENLLGNYTDGYERYQLCLELVDNGYFIPTLDSVSQVRILKFDNAVEQPEWIIKTANGDAKKWPEAFGSWHPFTFIKLVEFFHAFEEINPETYKKIVKDFGENLEHIPYGDYAAYGVIFRKYLISPLYNYINDPANREYILSEYPDYPFDIPNPYAETNL